MQVHDDPREKKSQGGHNDRRAKLVWYLLDVYFTPCSEFAQLKHFQTRVGGGLFLFFLRGGFIKLLYRSYVYQAVLVNCFYCLFVLFNVS